MKGELIKAEDLLKSLNEDSELARADSEKLIAQYKDESKGDWQQVKSLSKLYRDTYIQKEVFLEDVEGEWMNVFLKAEYELKLCKYTALLKAIDAKIHHLLFDSDLGLEQEEPRPLVFYCEKSVQSEYVNQLLSKIVKMEAKNKSLERANKLITVWVNTPHRLRTCCYKGCNKKTISNNLCKLHHAEYTELRKNGIEEPLNKFIDNLDTIENK